MSDWLNLTLGGSRSFHLRQKLRVFSCISGQRLLWTARDMLVGWTAMNGTLSPGRCVHFLHTRQGVANPTCSHRQFTGSPPQPSPCLLQFLTARLALQVTSLQGRYPPAHLSNLMMPTWVQRSGLGVCFVGLCKHECAPTLALNMCSFHKSAILRNGPC